MLDRATANDSGSPAGATAPQGVPPERLAALREAFEKVVKDKDLIAGAQKRAIYLEPTPGTEVQKASDSIIHTPKDIVDVTAKAFDSF